MDTEHLQEIVAALGRIGSQLDAADRLRDHSPWAEIAMQEAEIKRRAGMLSARFRSAHADLVARLATSHDLHLAWADLRDEVKLALEGTQTEVDVVLVEAQDPEMRTAIQRARDSLEEFTRSLAAPREGQTYFGIKARLPVEGSPGEYEHLWLSEVSQLEGGFRGRIANEPVRIDHLQLGDAVDVSTADVSDWMIIEQGELIGGFTARALKAKMSDEKSDRLERRAGMTIPDDDKD